jgi:tRNA (guanine-N7-)-methyltransferase
MYHELRKRGTSAGEDRRRPARAFFGRRKGHKLKPRSAQLLATLLPQLALDLKAPAPPRLATLYSEPVEEVRLEIGFGSGEHLIADALNNPRLGFIGVEPYINGMARALAAIAEHSLANIRLHLGDATDVLAWLAPASLTRIDLIYPDPWPKRRHWKRRFVQERMIVEMARVIRAGGEFRFVSDIPDYVAWTLLRMLRSREFEWTAKRANDWGKPWPGFSPTRYETKAKREGRVPCYLTFHRGRHESEP